MLKNFTLDYWVENGWYIGKLRELPGVFSQGENLEELKLNIKDAYALVVQETAAGVFYYEQAAGAKSIMVTID